MASSGSIISDKWNGRYLSFEWTATPSTTTPGVTTVSWNLYGRGGTSSPTTYYTKAELYINGTQVWRIWDESTSYANSKKKSGTIAVNHRWDGEGSFSVNLYVVKIYDVLDWYTNSATIALDNNKPNSVNFEYPAVFSDEEIPFNIKYENLTGSAIQAIKVGITAADRSEIVPLYTIATNANGNIGSGTYSFNFSSEINKLYTATVNTNSLNVYLTLQEEYGEYTYTANKVVTFNVINANPTLDPKIIDSNSITKTLTGSTDSAPKFILGYSNASVTFNSSTKKQATVASQTVTDNSGKILRNGDGAISPVNDSILNFRIVDSRGNAATVSKTLTTIPYLTPSCQIKSVVLNSNTQLKVAISGMVFYGSFGSKDNTFTVKYRYKNDSEGGSYGNWTSISPTINAQNFTYEFNVTVTNAYQNYTFQIQLSDALTTFESNTFIYTTGQQPILKVKDGNNIVYTIGAIKGTTVGKSAYTLAFSKGYAISEANFIQQLNKQSAFPIGTVYATLSETSPADMFGGQWMQITDKFIFGAGKHVLSDGTIGPGKYGLDEDVSDVGEATVTLTVEQLPSHNHTARYTYGSSGALSVGTYRNSRTNDGNRTTYSAGSGGAHNNIPPYLAVYFYERVG